ncbi:hypothetical protein BW247_13380 [Acidihalobacter ferrooxydans]|uniref:Uncharacterized protein n=1 Tax=Acidihalobacter ferrooxydans TaxID=1765967 RepID=A0A1P8UJI7_9GAMM|nr:hypothetical protein BW247_13380 [Acidihalobacter ferrooxydans]
MALGFGLVDALRLSTLRGVEIGWLGILAGGYAIAHPPWALGVALGFGLVDALRLSTLRGVRLGGVGVL